jgi:Fe-S-cluster containining protein
MITMDYSQGIRFKCQGSSNCCVSRGEYGFVYLSNKDIQRLCLFTKLKKNDFIRLYCDKTDEFTHLREKNKNGNCIFLKNKKCSIYKARPTQCRTWPFWSENLNAKKWNGEISKFCPGIGKGEIISKKAIKENMDKDDLNEVNMLKEIR